MQKVYQQKILDMRTREVYRYEILYHDELYCEPAVSALPIGACDRLYVVQELIEDLIRVASGLPEEVQRILSINVTNRVLVQSEMLEILLEHLHDLPYGLTIEVTQTGDLPKPRAMNAVLKSLREHNCSVDFDNFGGSNSNNPQILSEYFFDSIKLNSKFVQSALADERFIRLLVLLNELIRAQGKVVIATGVSTPTQSEKLAALGIVLQQGDYIHSPELIG